MNDELSKDHKEEMIAWQLQLDNLKFSNNRLKDNSQEILHLQYHQMKIDIDR